MAMIVVIASKNTLHYRTNLVKEVADIGVSF